MKDASVVAPRVRSALFVPGHRPELFDKAVAAAPDAIILDLEDAVPTAAKDAARTAVGAWLQARAFGPPQLCVRINALDSDTLDADLASVVRPGLTAVLVPKVHGAADVVRVAEALAYYEGGAGLPRGQVIIWPLIETAAAVLDASSIATASSRIAYMGAGTSQGGDLARALGYEWTAEGLETLWLRSQVLAQVRAAGVPNPVTGVVTAVDDLAAVAAFARQSRNLGYEGTMVIHPRHVAIANEVFSATVAEIAEAQAVVDTMAAAERSGLGAVNHDGRMIDAAMTATAMQLLEQVGDGELGQPLT